MIRENGIRCKIEGIFKVKKFEYLIESIENDNSSATLKYLGSIGWELIQVSYQTMEFSKFYFKREIKGKTEKSK